MADKPILFSAPMVRAIIDGRKTMTRRVIKPKPFNKEGDTVDISVAASAYYSPGWDGRGYFSFEHPLGGPLTAYRANYIPGDRLWVRETWHSIVGYNDRPPRDIPEGTPIFYCAGLHLETGWKWGKPRPSMFMPRWASRITLDVIGVKVERLQDISEADANAEGCGLPANDQDWSQCRKWFRELWTSINGAGSWEANPWVAAYTFIPMLKNIDEQRTAGEN